MKINPYYLRYLHKPNDQEQKFAAAGMKWLLEKRRNTALRAVALSMASIGLLFIGATIAGWLDSHPLHFAAAAAMLYLPAAIYTLSTIQTEKHLKLTDTDALLVTYAACKSVDNGSWPLFKLVRTSVLKDNNRLPVTHCGTPGIMPFDTLMVFSIGNKGYVVAAVCKKIVCAPIRRNCGFYVHKEDLL